MSSVGSVPAVGRRVAGEVPDVVVEHVAKGLNVAVDAGLFNSTITVSGKATNWFGDALRLSYNGHKIAIDGPSIGEGAKTALQIGTELRGLIEGATGALVTGRGDTMRYVIRTVHV